MSALSKRAEFYILLLMDLGDYDSARAAEIYRKNLKGCRSERELAEKCYLLIEQRRKELQDGIHLQ